MVHFREYSASHCRRDACTITSPETWWPRGKWW